MAPSPQPNAYLNTVLNSPPRPGHTVAQTFSATQRSLQARGKDFNTPVSNKDESYEVRQRREEAARILESAEMLIWWSSARNQVHTLILIPSTITISFFLAACIFACNDNNTDKVTFWFPGTHIPLENT
jgi:hypothetical protein